MRYFDYRGVTVEFEDDATDEYIEETFNMMDEDHSLQAMVQRLPSAMKQSLAGAVAGGAKIVEDVTGLDLDSSYARAGIAQEVQEQMPVGGYSFGEEALRTSASSLMYAAPAVIAGPLSFAAMVGRGMLPRTAASIAARGGATAIAVPTGLQTYGESREAGLGPFRSAVHALVDATVEKYTEIAPLDVLIRGTGFKQTIKRFMAREMAGEQIATALQDINAKLSYKPDMTFADYLRDAALTAASVGISGPIQAGISQAASAAVSPFMPDTPNVGAGEPAAPAVNETPGRVGTGVQDLLAGAPLVQPEAVAPTDKKVDLGQIEREQRPIPAGTMRVYTVVAPGESPDVTNQDRVWTSDRSEVQSALDAMGPQARVLYTNLTPQALQTQQAQAAEAVRNQIVDTATQFALPASAMSSANVLYGEELPRKETPVTTGQPLPKDTGPTPKVDIQPVKAPPAKTFVPVQNEPKTSYPLKSTVRRGAAGDVKLTMPDESTAALFEAGKLLKAKKVAKAEAILRDLSVKHGVPVSELTEAANVLRQQLAAQVRSAQKGTEVTTETPEVLRERELPRQEFTGETSKAVEGVVTLAKGVKITNRVEKAQALLQRWLKIFAPNMRIVIAGTADVGYLGSVTPQQDGSMNFYLPAESVSDARATLNLAHEFGHALVVHYLYHPENSRFLADLRREHQGLVARVDSMTIREFLAEWSGPGNQRVDLRAFGLTMDSPAWQYIRARDEAWKFNYIQLNGTKAYDRYVQAFGESYTLSFDEYAAEQVARYIKRNKLAPGADTPTFRDWLKALVEKLREFHAKVLGKFDNQPKLDKWLENLRAGNPEGLAVNVSSLPKIPKEFYELDTDAAIKYSLKALNTLPIKNTWKKVVIEAAAFRRDVRKQEKELILKVLATFPGNHVNRQEFTRAVLNELVPLNYVAVEPPYGGYVHRNINLDPKDGIAHIWQVPYEVEPDPHFRDPNYFGHALIHLDKMEFDGETEILSYNVIEVQSNLMQEGESPDRPENPYPEQTVQEQIEDLQALQAADEAVIAKLLEVTEEEAHILVARERFGATPTIGSRASWTTVHAGFQEELTLREIISRMRSDIGRREADIADLEGKLRTGTSAEKKANLPERWWELLIREEYRNAVDLGAKRFRMVTAETAARAEGWPVVIKEGFYPQLKGIGIAYYDESAWGSTLTGKVLSNGFFETIDTEGELGIVSPGEFTTTDFGGLHEQDVHEDLKLRFPELPVGYGDQQGIYNRYKNEIARFMQKEYGAKLVTSPVREYQVEENLNGVFEVRVGNNVLGHYATQADANMVAEDYASVVQRNTWWEADVDPNTHGLPLEYYELDEANKDVAENIAKAVADNPDVPDAPAIVRKMPRTMLAALQLNQIAKLLPDVKGLQDFRTAMQKMWNMKNQLMAGPNERIKQWYRLSVDDSHKVQQYLRWEVDQKRHLTVLVQEQIMVHGQPRPAWVHRPTEDFEIEMKSRGISPEGQKLIIDVKNDFLQTLDVMEATVLKSIYKYFRSNPFGARLRVIEAQKEFQKMREVPYLPHRRFGKWTVLVKSREDVTTPDGTKIKKGENIRVESFETRYARNQRLKELKSSYGNNFDVITSYVEDSVYVARGLPREFVQTIKDVLQLSPEDIEKLNELQYDFTKEGAYLKLLGKGKKETAGASEDIRRVYADYHWRTANLISKMAYAPELNDALREVKQEATAASAAGDTSSMLELLHERLGKTMNYVLQPQHEFEQMRAWVSLWYLWGVPKTAAMNFMSVPVFTAAYVQERYGTVQGTKHVLAAIPDAVTAIRNPEKLSADEQALIQQAIDDGVIDQSFAAELAAVSDANAMEHLMPRLNFFKNQNLRDSMQKAIWRVVGGGMLPFRAVEKFNRAITLLAVYRAEVQRGGATISSGDKASYLKARDAVDYTQNEYNPWNRPAFMQGKQSLFLIFYSFVQHVGFFMFGGDKSWWRAWMIMFALAGLQGLPLVDDIIDILNAVWKKASGEYIDLRQEAREFAKHLPGSPDMWMHGMTHNLFGLGWDVSYSVGFGRMIPGVESAFSEGDFDSNFVRFMADAGGPFTSLTIGALKALHDDNPNTLMKFERVMPTAVRNAVRASRMLMDDEIVDGRGRTLLPDANALEIAGQALGASPTRKATRQEMMASARDMSTYYQIRRSNLMAMWHQARTSRDRIAERDVEERIREYNRSVPHRELQVRRRDLLTSSRARKRAEEAVAESDTTARRYRRLYEGLRDLYDVDR